MQILQNITDPIYNEKEYKGLDRFFLKFIHDKRDLPFVYLTLKITFLMLPLGIALYFPFINERWYLFTPIAVVFLYINNFVYKGSFGLMLHCTSHRTFFKKEYQFLNHYLPWVVGPFFGQTPQTYYSHHIWMHHPENNLLEDDSTTMIYKRNSFKEFMKYFLTFLTVGMIGLVKYFQKKNRKDLIAKCLSGEILYILMCVGLSFISFKATFVVFILTFLISRFIMMLGNWTQHAFICPDEPGNAYKNSVTCVNTKYNHKCWNDGYHISHHIRPGMHWTQHPVFFQDNIDEFSKNKAMVFQGIGFLEIFYFLMKGKYEKLAEYAVNINGNTFKDDEEFISLVKHRTNWKVAKS